MKNQKPQILLRAQHSIEGQFSVLANNGVFNFLIANASPFAAVNVSFSDICIRERGVITQRIQFESLPFITRESPATLGYVVTGTVSGPIGKKDAINALLHSDTFGGIEVSAPLKEREKTDWPVVEFPITIKYEDLDGNRYIQFYDLLFDAFWPSLFCRRGECNQVSATIVA